jgi:hypothetical protein
VYALYIPAGHISFFKFQNASNLNDFLLIYQSVTFCIAVLIITTLESENWMLCLVYVVHNLIIFRHIITYSSSVCTFILYL